MKKVFILFAVAIIISKHMDAKIWRVNNNAGVTADFTTAQAAHNAAQSGDTLHLEPSLNSYGNLSMSKRLTVISTGSFITQNPGYQSDIRSAYINDLSISNTGANNSVIMVRFYGEVYINSNVNSILLSNCASFSDCGFQCQSININNADNIIIRQCAIGGINYVGNSNGILITNNIILRSINSDASSDAIITNNVINTTNVNSNNCAFNNSQVSNNIFCFTPSATFTNCVVNNNLCGASFLPANNSNLNNINMSTVFVNHLGGFIDNAFQLKAGSPAIGAGQAGIDCGAFGGPTPFKLAVTPPIPSIFQLNVPSSSSGNSMNITFSARSNN